MLRGFALPKISVLAVLVTVLGLVVGVQLAAAPHAARAAADVSTGSAGVFVSDVGRLMDTRDGTGGYSTPMAANTARSVAVAGHAGVPTTGVSALALTLTVINAGAAGTVTVAPGDVSSPNQIAASLTFNAANSVSNTAMVALHSDGGIKVVANTAVNLVVDIQGYFTSGSATAAGGFVPVAPTRIADTSTGTGVVQGMVAGGSSTDVQVTGLANVPASATSVYANITVSGQTSNGYLRAYPTGGTVPTTDALDFDSGTAMGQSAAVGIGTAGKITILVGPGAPVNISVDVQGYFTSGGAVAPVFTPAQLHFYDSRGSTPLAAGEVRQIQVEGMSGVPGGGDGVSAVALNMRTVATSTPATGWLRVWADDGTEPATTNISYDSSNTLRTNVAIVSPGADGKVSIRNGGNGPIDLVLDVEGWFSVTLPTAVGTNCAVSGDRAGAKTISHSLTDRSKLVFSPVTGNLLATGQLLHLAGVDQDVNVAWRYNPINDARPTLSMGYAETALSLNATDSSLTYTAPGGGCYTFAKTGTNWSVPPAGINASIKNPSTGVYDLTFYPSGLVYEFTDDGTRLVLTKSMDKYSPNPNTISYAYGSGHLVTITDTRGKVTRFTYTDVANPSQPSAILDGTLGRAVRMSYDGPSGAMSKITDATGAVTTFGYNASGLVNTITDARGTQTTMTYASDHRATGWVYAAGTPDASAWTAAYPSSTQTTVTDPNSHTSSYTIDTTTHAVSTITDPLNHQSKSSWDPHDNITSSTTSLGNASSYTFSSLNMVTKATSPAGSAGGTGASTSYSYPTAVGSLADYQPTDSTSSQGNKTTYGYDRNDVSTVGTPGNAGGTPTMHRQGDSAGTDCSARNGETCTSTNGNGKTTSYAYDSSGRVITENLPAPLGSRAFSYDTASRLTSESDGRGNTTYYAYDDDDRTTVISHSPSSCPTATCVTYAYDTDGNKTSTTSGTGTTGFGYDRLNRPTSKSFNAATVSAVTYDGASNLTSFTDTGGPITYSYDAANRMVLLAQPGGSCPTVANAGTLTSPNSTKCSKFDYDNDNKRTHVVYPNGQRIDLQYNKSGTVSSIVGTTSGGGVLASRAYTYNSATSGTDSGLRDTMTDAVTGVKASYAYDPMDRLTNQSDTTTATGASAGGYSWTYDRAGNRLTAAHTGQASSYAAYNDADEQCWTGASSAACTAPPAGATTYGYDPSGNQTSAGTGASTVNVFNQVTSIQTAGVTTPFTYADADNTERTTTGATTYLNGNLGITAETTNGTRIEYTRDPAGNLIAATSAGSDYYYTTDALGSVILLTSPTQTISASYTYDAWGNTTTSTGTLATTNPWRYATGYTDNTTGLLKLGARYYNPTTGRFTQPDPSHQETNNYTYAGDNPTNNTDPSGLDFWSSDVWDFTANVGGGIGGAILGGTLGCALGEVIDPFGGCVIGAVLGADAGASLGAAGLYLGEDGSSQP